MKATHPCVVLFLLLSGCALDAMVPDSGGGDDDGDGNGSGIGFGSETGGASASGQRVCVYQSGSDYFCADGYSDYDTSVECEPSSSLDACLSAHESIGSCSGSCCVEASYWGHTIFDGPCEVALAHANSSGTGNAALIDDRCGVTLGKPSCDDCVNEHCANECTGCANEPGCLLVAHCANGCETDSCIETCFDFYANGYETLVRLFSCLDAHCLDACG
jgi:hypothetical protein